MTKRRNTDKNIPKTIIQAHSRQLPIDQLFITTVGHVENVERVVMMGHIVVFVQVVNVMVAKDK